MLVETINHRKTAGATEATVLGPFHMVASPRRELGDTIDLIGTGPQTVVKGRVLSVDGTPLPAAELDVWQASDQGFYDVQQPGVQPRGNGRGLFTADADGAFWFRTVVPSYYPIPTDGPVGSLLAATKRHPYRPAHIHFIASAPGHSPLTTHIFVAGSEYIESDAVFAVSGVSSPISPASTTRPGGRVRPHRPVPPGDLRHRPAARALTAASSAYLFVMIGPPVLPPAPWAPRQPLAQVPV